MSTPAKLILGAVATGCIVVGVAAQTGTVQLPRVSSGGPVSGQQQAAPATAQPSAEAPPSPSPTPDTTTVATSSGDEDVDDEGDGGGHGNGHGHKD